MINILLGILTVAVLIGINAAIDYHRGDVVMCQMIEVEFFGGPKDGMILMVDTAVKEHRFVDLNMYAGGVVVSEYVLDKDDDGLPCMKYKGAQ